jgi:hypothetical protein
MLPLLLNAVGIRYTVAETMRAVQLIDLSESFEFHALQAFKWKIFSEKDFLDRDRRRVLVNPALGLRVP